MAQGIGVESPRPAGISWERRYGRRLAVTDVVVVVWAVIRAQLARFGVDGTDVVVGRSEAAHSIAASLSYTMLSLFLIVVWMLTLFLYGTRDPRTVGVGSTEYKRIFDATLRLFGVIAIIAFLFKLDVARSYVLLAFPIGTIVLIGSRWLWRQWLISKRTQRLYSSRVVLIGSLESVVVIARDLMRFPGAGYLVVAAISPGDGRLERLPGTTIPLGNDLDGAISIMDAVAADTLVVTSSDQLPPSKIRELSWSLEPGRHHLVVAPSLTDVGGPRIHMRPVVGLPLMHVETPRYKGFKRFSKRAFDVVSSAIFIVLLSPLFAAVAMTIRLSSPGPVFFLQERVGYKGERFRMIKFRSMVIDAEEQLAALAVLRREEGNAVMFKMRDDPRVTPIGRFIRRYSIDELPQLFNVFAGSMSIVGPRPPLEREVAVYENHVHRRFLVKPGVTGLWQVSGRSNLSWEDSVRLDLYYVENWSITGDLMILWRTARAVLGRDGAY